MTFGIRTRLYGIVVVFTVGLCVTAWLLLSLEFDALKSRRQQELKGLVETALSLVTAQYELAKDGQLPEAEAKAHAAAAVGKLRYQGDNYFWINDLHPTMVMHPVRPDLDGKDLVAIKDPNGLALFVEFAKVAGQNGSGFVDYMWPKPGFDKPVEKTSYVALFKPWGWIIGTGVYNDDIAAEREHAVKTAGGIGIPIVLLVVGLAFFSARSITGRMRKLNAATIALTDGALDIDIDDGGRSDEIGVVFGALEHFRKVAIEKNRADVEKKKMEAATLAAAAANLRVRSALDCSKSNMMIADNDYNIIYMNSTMLEMFRAAEAKIRRELPQFDSSCLMGQSIDVFHRDPGRIRKILDGLTGPHEVRLGIAGESFQLIAVPVLDARASAPASWSNGAIGPPR